MPHSECNHFLYLENRIMALRTKYMDAQMADEKNNPGGFTPDPEFIAAFRLFAHAEIQVFIEKKANEGLDAIEKKIKLPSQNLRGNAEFFLLAARLSNQSCINSKLEASAWPDFIKDPTSWKKYLQSSVNHARKFVEQNNGVKGDSIRYLALFHGKMPDEIDEALIMSLNDFGTGRGNVAHNSVPRITNILAPSIEYKAILDIINGLKELYFPTGATYSSRWCSPSSCIHVATP